LLSATPGFCLDSICYRLSLTCASPVHFGFCAYKVSSVHREPVQDTYADRILRAASTVLFARRPVIAKRPSESILILQTADLAASRSCSSGTPIESFKIAAIFVDFIHILLRNGRRAMKYNGESRYTSFYFFQYIETQRRRNQSAVFVARTLLGFKFIGGHEKFQWKIANESTPVRLTKSTTSSGSV